MMSNDTPSKPAYDRFVDSMVMDYDKWHDGIGYDLAALREMSPDDRASVSQTLRIREQTWRELEALAVLAELDAGPAQPSQSRQAIEASLKDDKADTRLAAAELLRQQGRMKDFDQFLAREIRNLNRIEQGLTRALLLAEQYPSETVKQALLYASWNRTECATHCAALLCYLAGVATSPFDWSLRPLFLRLGPNNSYFERKAAFDELSEKVNMTLDESQGP